MVPNDLVHVDTKSKLHASWHKPLCRSLCLFWSLFLSHLKIFRLYAGEGLQILIYARALMVIEQ